MVCHRVSVRFASIRFFACHGLLDSNQAFDNIFKPDVYAWSAVILANARLGQGQNALELYHRMEVLGVKSDTYTCVAVLKGCTVTEALFNGRLIHHYIIRSGFELDVVVGSTLVHMYSTCDSLQEACMIFKKMVNRDRIAWNAMISAYAYHGKIYSALQFFLLMQHEGIDPNVISWNAIIGVQHVEGYLTVEYFYKMQEGGIEPNEVTFLAVLKSCTATGALTQGRRIHEQILAFGLQLNLLLGSTLIHMYAICGSLWEAWEVFDGLQYRDVVSWNAMIAGYAQHGQCNLALECFKRMQKEGTKPNVVSWNALIAGHVHCGEESIVLQHVVQMQKEGITPNVVTFFSALKACANKGAFLQGKLIHGQVIRRALQSDNDLGNSLIDMYLKCGSLDDAFAVFQRGKNQNVVSWNSLIAGFAQHGEIDLAMECFKRMQLEGVKPDGVTFTTFLTTCVTLAALEQDKLHQDEVIAKKFMSTRPGMFCNLSIPLSVMDCFEQMQKEGLKPNIVTWNAVIAAHVQHGQDLLALESFKRLQCEGMQPNEITFLSVLKACSSIGAIDQGRLIHEQIARNGLDSEVVVGSTMVDMYAKCGDVEEAQRVFNKLEVQNVVSWTAMVSGYCQQGKGLLALACFEKMKQEGISPNKVTFSSILKACIIIGTIEHSRLIHEHIIGNNLQSDIVVGNSLVDMYAKYGSLNEACKVFHILPNIDVVSWGTMITGYSQFGEVFMALEYFEKMQKEGLRPDPGSCTSVLTAYSRAGLVDEGRWFFYSMRQYYGFMPIPCHHSCMVDLLGHAGFFSEAEDLLWSTMEAHIMSWISLLNACRLHSNVEVARRCFDQIATYSAE